MIIERITLGAIYRTLLQLETNEGKVTNIVLDYKSGTKTYSPPVFPDLNSLKTFINNNYPYIALSEDAEICAWYPFNPVKFWVDKSNGIQVDFKESLKTTKGKLFAISEKRLRELNQYLKQISIAINFDNYISPNTPSYVECVYISDVVEDGGYEIMTEEYKKYAKL